MKKAFRWLVLCGLMLLLPLFTIEFAYRFQLFDFYKTEITLLNPPFDGSKKTLLVLGDSFSADPRSYVSQIRTKLPDWNVVNAAVPGTGIREVRCIAPGRLVAFKPSIVLLQLYVGNDLADIHHQTTANTSVFQRVYWWLSERLLILRWLNYKAGQLKANTVADITTRKDNAAFSVQQFSSYEKKLIAAEPRLIENAVQLTNGRQQQFRYLMWRIKELKEQCDAMGCSLQLLIIPHCAQLNDYYSNHLRKCGAVITNDSLLHNTQYPFSAILQSTFKEVIDPLPEFQRTDSANHRLYYANDIHLNERGHHLLGNLVAAQLKR